MEQENDVIVGSVSGAGTSDYTSCSHDINSQNNVNIVRCIPKGQAAYLAMNEIGSNKLPLMSSLSLSKCKSTFDIQHLDSCLAATAHQYHRYHQLPSITDFQHSTTASDAVDNCQHQFDGAAIASSICHKTPITAGASSGIATTTTTTNSNDLMCFNSNFTSCSSSNSNRFNQKSSTLTRPPSLATADAYSREYENKLYKLQTFIRSTPDLTQSDSSSGHNSCIIEHDSTRASKDSMESVRPDVIQMHDVIHTFQVPAKTLFKCHHHHQHNQGASSTNVSGRQQQLHQHHQIEQQLQQQNPKQNATSPIISSTRF